MREKECSCSSHKNWQITRLRIDIDRYQVSFGVSDEDSIAIVIPDRASTSPEELILSVLAKSCS